MSDVENKAVFLSYASQDAEAARRIADALRTAGVEVWFDQNELVGGDAWDAKIRKQIAECALFVPVISAATQARLEGYFRIEWKLAARRTHAMATARAFLLPVVIDATRDAEAHVPDEFRDVQWTRLPGGENAEKFSSRVKALLGGVIDDVGPVADRAPGQRPGLQPKVGRGVPAAAWIAAAAIVVAVGVVFAIWQPWRRGSNAPAAATVTAPVATPQTEMQKLLARVWAIYEKQDDATGQDWALAEDLAAQATKLEPTNADAWAAYSQATLGPWVFGYERTTTRFSDARGRAERALGLAPDSFEARFAVANCHRRQTATRPDAEKALRALVAERPADKRTIRMLAHTLRDSGRTDEAIQWLERAAALPGGDPIAVWGKFSVYAAAGRYEEAEAAVTQSLAIRRGPTALLRQVALRLLWHGDLEGATAALRDVPGPFLQKAEGIYGSYLLGRWRRDSNACLTALQLASGDVIEGGNYLPSSNGTVPTGLWRGDAYALAGNRDAAEKNWRDALAVVERRAREQPGESAWIFWRASLQARLGERAEGLRNYRLFQQLTGTETSPVDRLNYSWETMVLAPLVPLGEHDEALAGWEKAIATAATPRHREIVRNELRLDPLYDGLRDHPRFRALVAAPSPNSDLPSPSRSPSADAKSVAVLAFKNLSGDPAREFFSDGLSEAVTDVLGRVPGLKVVGSASAFSFKGKAVPIPEIARQLGVTHLVEGTVLQEGQTVRITAKLIKADGFQVWVSDKLDRELKNIFALHDEVAGLIAKNLSLKLGASSAASTVAVNPQAYELYVQARQAWNLRTTAGYDLAESALTRVLALEPNFARAHAALADVWMGRLLFIQQASEGEDESRSAVIARSMAKITRALTVDPDSAEAHASLGLVLTVDGKSSEAESALRRAVALNPNYASGHSWLSRVLLAFAQMDEALEHSRFAIELDPLSPQIWDNHANWLIYAGRPTEAIIACDRALTLQPNYINTLRSKSSALVELGRFTEAVALVKSLPSDNERNRRIQLFVYARAGLKAEAEALLSTLRPDANGSDPRPRGLLAVGRTDEALALMTSKQIQRGSWGMVYLWDSIYDPVRNDPRWLKLIADAGLTEAHVRAQAWRKAHPPEKAATK